MLENAASLTAADGAATLAPPRRPNGNGSPIERLRPYAGAVSLAPAAGRRHPVRDTRITVASAVVVVSVLALQDWQTVRQEPYFHRFLVMDAIAGLVLAPLLVASFLTLRACVSSLLQRLEGNGVIGPAGDGRTVDQFARTLDRWLDHLVRPTVIATAGYLAYTMADALDDMRGPLTTLLNTTAVAVQAALFFLGVLTVLQIWTVCRAVGRLLRDYRVQVRLLHPDGCGGLWPVGHLLSFVLYFAAVLGGASLCMFLALPDTPSALTRRPEPYALAVFYAMLLPSALLNALWRPHQRMVRRRQELLVPVAASFGDAVGSRGPRAAGDPAGLRAANDRLVEISRHAQLLDEACPVWPLPARRLRTTLATAVLPVAIPVVTAIITSFLTPGP